MRVPFFICASVLVGCYTYRPLGTAQPASGTRVSAELTDEGARDLTAQVGPDVEHLEGEVVSVQSDSVELAVQQVENSRGIQSDWNGERITLPSSAVSGWQQRRLSVGGTSFLGGLVAGGLYAMYRLLGGPGLISGRGGGTGGGGAGH